MFSYIYLYVFVYQSTWIDDCEEIEVGEENGEGMGEEGYDDEEPIEAGRYDVYDDRENDD